MIRRILLEDNPKDKAILSDKSAHVSVHEEDKMFLAKGYIADLKDTLLNELTGIGMAANQIGICARIIIMKRGDKITEFINPEILHKFGDGEIESEEGCLSRPGKKTKVRRAREIQLRWCDENRRVRLRKFSGMPAIIIQHEIDHLNGILI